MYAGLDYEVLAYCQYGVYIGDTNEVMDCGEPATHRAWWEDDGSDAMLLCKEHFEFIKQAEKAPREES